jgi:hypothetical protein
MMMLADLALGFEILSLVLVHRRGLHELSHVFEKYVLSDVVLDALQYLQNGGESDQLA